MKLPLMEQARQQMGRGRGEGVRAGGLLSGGRRGARDLGPGGARLIGDSARAKVTRDLSQRTFVADIEEWKKQENSFVEGALEELNAAVSTYAASDEGWRSFLRLYAESPRYSAINVLWARAQLAARAVRSDGLVFSESGWAALGRRVKAEYARPEAKRDRRYDYDREREWDPTYAAEMMKPIGFNGYWKDEVDANGNPVRDASGKSKRRFIPLAPKAFGTFVAYHEDATEAIDGSDPKPLARPPWHKASGSDEDATKMISDLEKHVLNDEEITIEYRERRALSASDDQFDLERDAAVIETSNEGQTKIVVDASAPAPVQAAAVLGIVCDRAGRELAPGADDDDRARDRAAGASAKHVIASLYGLDAKDQAFPHLSAIGDQKGGLGRLTGEIHHRVGSILGRLDPRMQMMARAEGQRQAERRERLAARKSKAKAKKRRPAKSKPKSKQPVAAA